MWVFIFGDLVVFAVFFVTFLVYRMGDPDTFMRSQALLDRGLGLLNTLLLLTSSWFVARAVQDARGTGLQTRRLVAAGMACGVGFCGVKVVEYHAKIAAGLTLNTNDFFIFYYMFTGIHLIHVLIGLGVLAFLFHSAHPSQRGTGHIALMEGGAAFWHLVDLLWIVLFPLFYLLR